MCIVYVYNYMYISGWGSVHDYVYTYMTGWGVVCSMLSGCPCVLAKVIFVTNSVLSKG